MLIRLILAEVAKAPSLPRGTWGWLADPRSAVLLTLGSVIILGGSRKLYLAMKARQVVARLSEIHVTEAEILAASKCGRAGLRDLFELLATSTNLSHRDAAGQTLSALWTQDELIGEEEKALVLRGYKADWHARRRYPRRLTGPIPIQVDYGVSFLKQGGVGLDPHRLEWRHRILGAERLALEEFTPWKSGHGRAEFAITPGDYVSNGPHRLSLHAQVRTVGLTGPWELDLPHLPFPFELDPLLDVGSLRTMPDEVRAERFATSIALQPGSAGYLVLSDEFALRDPPWLCVKTPLPADLAHMLFLEFEGVPGRFAAGKVIVSGQGTAAIAAGDSVTTFLEPPSPKLRDQIGAPGEFRLRVILSPSDELGWTDPAIRSTWPGEVVTEWLTVKVVRL